MVAAENQEGKMKRLVRFAAALTAVLLLTACAAEVGTGAVTSEPLPCVTAEPEEEEDKIGRAHV